MPADHDAVISIYKNGWLDTYPNEKYGISLAAVREVTRNFKETNIHRNKFIAEVDGEVIGVISVKEGGFNLIQSLYVKKEFQGKGIGTALLQHVFKKFGHNPYTLKVAVYNKEAIRFYKKFGFGLVTDSLEEVNFYNLKIPQISMVKL